MSDRGISVDDLGKDGLTPSTLRRRLKAPATFQVGELLYLGRKLNIPIEEIRECIHY